MKLNGITRSVDELGRIVIPKDYRKLLDIKEEDVLEISVQEDKIIIKKMENTCIFCDSKEDLLSYKGKFICSECRKKIGLSFD